MDTRALIDAHLRRTMKQVVQRFAAEMTLQPGNRVQIRARGALRTYDVIGEAWCPSLRWILSHHGWRVTMLHWQHDSGATATVTHKGTGEQKTVAAATLPLALLMAALEIRCNTSPVLSTLKPAGSPPRPTPSSK